METEGVDLQIDCPHCANQIEIVPDLDTTGLVSCPSCGSQFPQLAFCETVLAKPHTKIGRYELLQLVGQGQFGYVWRAEDTRLGRIVALKVPRTVDPQGSEHKAFLREARAVAAVDHPNVIKVLDVDEADGQSYIVSEFIDGVTLGERLKQRRLNCEQAAQMMQQVAQGVHAAHEKGIVHRDLKPSNILLDDQDRPVVTDFGLAKNNASEITMTTDGVVLGTPAYMSPEQARGNSHLADERSDVYSLGVIFYELITGKRPFDGASTLLLQQIQHAEPLAPRSIDRQIPRDLETICLKAMHKEPAKRYSNAKQMADDLERFLQHDPILASRPGWGERTFRKVRKNWMTSLVVALTFVSASLLLIVVTSSPDGPTSQAASVVPVASQTAVERTAPVEKPEMWQPIAWESVLQSDSWHPADEDGPLRIQSTACFACLLATEPLPSHYQIRMETQLHHDVTLSGLAVGVHQTGENPVTYSGYLIEIGPSLGEPQKGIWIALEKCNFRPSDFGHMSVRDRIRLTRFQIDKLYSNPIELAVEIDDNTIVDIQYQGRTISDLEKFQSVVFDSPAKCGVVALGHATFPEFYIQAR